MFIRKWRERNKKMEQAIKDLIAEFEERLKEYGVNEQIYNKKK